MGWLAFALPTHAQDDSGLIHRKSTQADYWYYDVESGYACGSMTRKNKLVIFDADLELVAEVEVGEEPKSNIIKSGKVAVARRSFIDILDARSGEKLKLLDTDIDTSFLQLFASEKEDDLIYAWGFEGTNYRKRRVSIAQINLTSMEVVNRIQLDGDFQSKLRSLSFSKGGKNWIARAQGMTGAQVMKLDEKRLEVTEGPIVPQLHVDAVQTPQGMWIHQRKLYPEIGKPPTREFPGAPTRLHSRLDLAVSVGKHELFFQSYLQDRPPIKLELIGQRGPQRSFGNSKFTMVLDERRERVFLATYSRGVYWVDFGSFDFPTSRELEPVLVNGELPKKVIDIGSGLTQRVSLSQLYEMADTPLTAKLNQAPAFATLEGDQLILNPPASEIGKTHEIQLTVNSPKNSLATTIDVNIGFTTIKLNQRISTWALSPNGKTLLLLGFGGRTRGAVELQYNYQVVDTETREITADGILKAPTRIVGSAINDDSIFVATDRQLFRLDHQGQQHRQAPLANNAQKLKLWDNRIGVNHFGRDTMGRPIYSLFDLDNLEKIVIDRKTGQYRRLSTISTGARNEAQGSTRLNIPGISQQHKLQFDPSSTPRPRYGADVTDSTLSSNNMGIANFGPGALCRKSSTLPVFFRVHQHIDPKTKIGTTTFEVCDLLFGDTLSKNVVWQQKLNSDRILDKGWLIESNGVLVYHYKQVIYFLNYPSEAFADIPAPIDFAANQIHIQQVGKVAKLEIPINGPREDCRFQLDQAVRGVTLDQESGRLSIDTVMLWDSFMTQSMMRFLQIQSPQAYYDKARMSVATSYGVVTGKKLARGKMAAVLNIPVTLTNKTGHQDSTSLQVILVGKYAPK